MVTRGATTPFAHGKGMPKTSFTTRCDSWEPPTTLHQTDLEHEVEVVDRGALHSDWKMIKERGYGTHFSGGTMVDMMTLRSFAYLSSSSAAGCATRA